MKRLFTLLLFLIIAEHIAAQDYLANGGFESSTAGSFASTTSSGTINNTLAGQWQLTFVTGSCSGGCATGSGTIVTDMKNSGANAIKINITKQTNRNDIKLFQVIPNSNVPVAGSYTVTFYMKSDVANYPVTVDVLKSTQGSTTNGSVPYAAQFATSTQWTKYTMNVDISSWTAAERTNMRISIRPNTVTGTATPIGSYPKNFWFDDIKFEYVPSDPPLTTLKEVAIKVAKDRKALAEAAGFTDEVNTLDAQITVLMNSNPALPITPVKAIGFNPVPAATTAVSNPFIQALNNWGTTYLSQPFTGYLKAKAGTIIFTDGEDARALGTVTENLYWLIVSPYSAHRYNLELFKRYLTIIYATSDDYLMNGNEGAALPGSSANGLNDWFAAPKACYSWWMAETSFSEYIPDLLKQRLQNAAQLMGTQFKSYSSVIDNNDNYTNRDISYAETLMYAGLYRNNTNWIDFSKHIVDIVDSVDRAPDGAYLYIENQNEVANYHGATNNSLAKIWAVSEYQKARDCVAQAAIYELISIEKGNVPEFYTAPAWKTQWNGLSGYSAEPLVAISQNPYLKTRYNQLRAIKGYTDEMPLSLAYYDPSIASAPLPASGYVCYDRNIQGPRGRNGQFSYAATGRKVAVPGSNDPGLQTVVGAMETETSASPGNDLLNSALMAVHSKVHVRKSATPAEWTDWAYMMAKTSPKSCVAKNVSTISTPGVLQYQTSGPTGVESNWGSYQQWITLPDRIIGIVETSPKNNVPTNAYEIDGRVRFTYGRSGSPTAKTLIEEVPGIRYSYGKFKAIIHAHDYSTVTTGTAGVLRDDYPNSMEIIFRYNQSSGTQYSYPANTKKYFIVEIRDEGATGDATVSRVTDGGIKGLVVKLNGKSYASLRNDGTSPANVDLSNISINGNYSQVHFSREDALVNQAQTITTNSYAVPANEQVLIVSTSTAEDLGNGWENYPALLAANGVFVDNQKPTLNVPANLGHCNDISGNYTIPVATASDDAAVSNISYNITGATQRTGTGGDASGQFNIGASTITWTATDVNGNTTTGTTVVTISSPMQASIPDVYVNTAFDDKNTLYTAYGPTSFVVKTLPQGGTAPYTYLWNTGATTDEISVSDAGNYGVTITDALGCTATATTEIFKVADNVLPVITVPADIQTNTDAGLATASNVTLGTATATDQYGIKSITNDAPSVFPVGTTTVTWTVTNNHDHAATATQLVVVTDNESPVLIAPAVQNFCNAGATYQIPAVIATDNVAIDTISYAIAGATQRTGNGGNASGLFNLGTSTITWTVTDLNGNTTTGTTVLTIKSPMQVSIPDVNAKSVWDAKNTIYTAYGPSSLVVKGLSQGGTAPYVYLWNTGATTDEISVSDAGNYSVTITDALGCTTAATIEIFKVEDTELPVISVPANIQRNTDTGLATASNVNLGTVTATDQYGIKSITNNAPSVFPVGTTTVIWTATNNHNHSSTATQLVVVTDNESPVLVAPAAQNFCYTGNSYQIPVATATDNVSITGISYVITGATQRTGTSADASGQFNVGTSTITWTAIDGKGNTSVAATNVVVNASLSVSIPNVYAMNSTVDDKNTIYLGYGSSSLTISAVIQGGQNYTYSWNTGATTPSITVSQAGTYTVTVTYAGSCQSSASIVINTLDVTCGNNNDKVKLCHNGNTICVAQSAVQAHLSHGDKLGSCGSLGKTTASSKQEGTTSNVTLYPNPVQDYFNVTVSQLELNAKITVYNVLGTKLHDVKFTTVPQQVFVGDLPIGTYFVIIQNGSQTMKNIIIKE